MKILVTAGATWIRVDKVRILTSIFTGSTGLAIAKYLKKQGHAVTLIINPHCVQRVRGLRVLTFRYFEEFKARVSRELRKTRYDAVIHSAAVSDYTLEPISGGKFPSGRKKALLRLKPAEKIIKKIRELSPSVLLVQFKLEIKRRGLIKSAYLSLKRNDSDFVVANALEDISKGYKAFLIDRQKNITTVNARKSLPSAICKAIFAKNR